MYLRNYIVYLILVEYSDFELKTEFFSCHKILFIKGSKLKLKYKLEQKY